MWCYASAAYAVMQFLSVCLCVCHIPVFCWYEWTYLKNLSPSGSHTILVFLYQMSWQYSIGDSIPPNEGIKCRYSMKNRYFQLVSRFIACCQCCDRQMLSTCCHRTVASWWHSLLVAVNWQSLLMAGDRRWSVYDKKHQRYARDNRTAFNCIQ